MAVRRRRRGRPLPGRERRRGRRFGRRRRSGHQGHHHAGLHVQRKVPRNPGRSQVSQLFTANYYLSLGMMHNGPTLKVMVARLAPAHSEVGPFFRVKDSGWSIWLMPRSIFARCFVKDKMTIQAKIHKSAFCKQRNLTFFPKPRALPRAYPAKLIWVNDS